MPKKPLEFCCLCGSQRPCVEVGKYRWEGAEYPLYACQWCRAAETRRKKREERRHKEVANGR